MTQREIKFRTWGDIHKECMSEPEMEYDITIENLLFHDGYYISTGGEAEGCYHIMQYTGLKDKNGKEIYEGDIVKMEHTDMYGTVWETFDVKFIDDWHGYNFPKNHAHTMSKTFEVIGNIHENPELIPK